MSPLSRADRGPVARWFWTIDHVLLALVIALIGVGLIAVAAGSPAAAYRYSGDGVKLPDLYFFQRHLLWVAAGVPLMIGTSMLSPAQVKRLGLIGCAGGIAALAAVLAFGDGANGATRWLMLGPVKLQPSEFVKPCFVVAVAAILAVRFQDPRAPTLTASFALTALVAGLLVLQPDLGQAVLFTAVWGVLAALAGLPRLLIAGGIGAAAGCLAVAYATLSHVRTRLDGFWKGEGDLFQVENALACFRAGGLFGVGPGEGTMKFRLPEAHNDYIFAVIGEEFGALGCLAVIALFIAVVARAVSRIMDEDDAFVFLASAGLAAQFGLQAAINMGVAVNLLPSKGMTLPFVSSGGSSFLALSFGMGLLLALGRRNPYEKASPLSLAARDVKGGPVLIAAGGTGGHMMPAHALSLELMRRGRRVVLLSDERGMRLPGLFEGVEKHLVPAGSPGRGGPLSWPRTLWAILAGRRQAGALVRRLMPAAAAGFGGYPSLPGLWAATAMGAPAILHEQNAVLGRVNRRFAGRVRAIATSYERVARLEARHARKVRLTGNPVRPAIFAVPPPAFGAERDVLVVGGSQGASVFSRVVPQGLAMVSDGRPVRVAQQAREGEIAAVREVYARAGVPAEVAPYFVDMGAALGRAELVVARAGASTIAELTACGRPSILVPLPTAMDDHQSANARALADAGGAVLIQEAEFTPERLAAEVSALTPERLARMAAAARALGRPRAAEDLADLIEEIAI